MLKLKKFDEIHVFYRIINVFHLIFFTKKALLNVVRCTKKQKNLTFQ